MSEQFPISFDVYLGHEKIGAHSVRNDREKQAVLKSLRRVYGDVSVQNETRPEDFANMYRGKEPFTLEQLAFAADCILVGALDMIESGLPDRIEWAERQAQSSKEGSDPTALTAYERGALEAAGEALSILYAQLSGDGMGCYDALCEAGHFDDAVGKMMAAAWQDEGAAVKAAIQQRHGRYRLNDVIPGYPDARLCALAFAAVVLDQLSKAPKRHIE